MNIKTEILAGVTTFVTMAYILVVNPNILSEAGMDRDAVFTATALASLVGCMLMGLVAKLPLAQAPTLGVNTFFAYTVVLGMGYTWQMALAGVLIAGIVFLLLSVFNLRAMIIEAIPPNLRLAISVGIGLFITVVGLNNAGVIVASGEGVFSYMGDIQDPTIYVTLLTVVLIGYLSARKVQGALLIGMVVATVVGIPLGITHIPDGFSPVSVPPSVAPVFAQFDFSSLLSWEMVSVVLFFVFISLFDTAGMLVAIAYKGNLFAEDGKSIKNQKQAFIADSCSIISGAVLGTSNVTPLMESTAGITVGGRTGLTAVTTGVMFGLALFTAPIFAIIPTAACSAALVIVGLSMMGLATRIDFEDYVESVPAFITIILTPLTFSISNGIMYGFLSYLLLAVAMRQWEKINVPMVVLGVIFVLKLVFL